MVNSINIFVYLHLEMIFLYSQDKRYSIFRIKHLLRNLYKTKSSLKRLSEQKTKVINQISFYEGILQKLQQYEGDVHYGNEDNEPIFTEQEIFYISMILGMRGCYERMKQLSELRFTEREKLHTELQKWLRRVIELDSTLFADYQLLNRRDNRIVPISSTVDSIISLPPILYDGLNEYQIWIQNLIKSFALLHDYESWRVENSDNDKWIDCCPAQCTCYIEDVEERIYKIICRNVFFNHYQHQHATPSREYWFNKAGSSFSSDN
jgi:hypothetical protein